MKDLVIVGGGPAGYTAAIRAARLGKSVALIESNEPGGTCLNKGCIPTKGLLHASHLYFSLKNNQYGIKADGIAFELNDAYKKTYETVIKLNGGIKSLLDASGVEYRNAKAKLTSSNKLELTDGTFLEAEKILLAVGASPVIPPIMGIENALTSEDILKHNYQQFGNVVIIGGGVIGIEFATFFAEAGSKVLVIDSMDSILSGMGEDIVKYTMVSLRKKGVKFVLKAKVTALEKLDTGIQTGYIEKEKQCTALSDIVICCVGRKANSIEGIENTKAIFSRGFETDGDGKTSDDNIYAAGDCAKGSIQLAHYASNSAVRIVERLYGNKEMKEIRNIPACVYTNPNIAIVGKREFECNTEDIETGKFNMGANGKSLIEESSLGFIKVIFDKMTKKLIGAELLCNNACEMIGGISNLINIGATREDILSSVYPHPSVSEGFFEAVEDSMKMSIHTIYK